MANQLVERLAEIRSGGGGRRHRRRYPPTPSSQKGYVGPKIEKLRDEGVPQEQAVATALSMARAKRLGPGGTYRRVGT